MASIPIALKYKILHSVYFGMSRQSFVHSVHFGMSRQSFVECWNSGLIRAWVQGLGLSSDI